MSPECDSFTWNAPQLHIRYVFRSWYSHAMRYTTPGASKQPRRRMVIRYQTQIFSTTFGAHTMHRATEIDGETCTYFGCFGKFGSFRLHSCRIDSDGDGGSSSSWLQNVRTSTRPQSLWSPEFI